MVELVFSPPLRVPEHFEVAPDPTPWTSRTYRKLGKSGYAPRRERAPFEVYYRSLLPASAEARRLTAASGIYVVAFDRPGPSFYVGVAEKEGILKRICKHRVKATASHVGTETTAGVAHTGGWQDFALRRYASVGPGVDDCADMRVVIGEFATAQPKAILHYFERAIHADGSNVRTRLYRLLWPEAQPADVRLITRGTSRGLRPDAPCIAFWDAPDRPVPLAG